MQRTFSLWGSCLCNRIFQQTPPTWRPPRRRVRRREQARDVGKPMSRSSWNCLITTRSCSISDILTWYCLSLSESLNARVNELTWPSFSWSTDRASIAWKKLVKIDDGFGLGAAGTHMWEELVDPVTRRVSPVPCSFPSPELEPLRDLPLGMGALTKQIFQNRKQLFIRYTVVCISASKGAPGKSWLTKPPEK